MSPNSAAAAAMRPDVSVRPLLESEFVGGNARVPPSIRFTTPVSGTYMLMVHDDIDGDDIVTHANLEGGVTARMPMLAPNGNREYWVQAMHDPFATHVMFTTVRYRPSYVYLPVALLADNVFDVYVPMMASQ